MSAVLLRASVRQCLVFTLCVLLASCGGGSGEDSPDAVVVSPPPVIVTPPVTIPPVTGTPVDMGVMVAFGYNSLAAGAPMRFNQVQSSAVGNGAASYRFPRSGETISGNLTIAVDVTDPDGIARVLVGFNGSSEALVLCETNCGTSFSQTVTGVNPRNFGLTPGSLRLELWLEDQLNNRVLFDARDIEWLPEAITAVNTSRTGTTAQVNWAANSNASRYNLYIAEQPGITPENILSKTAGQQFLALTQTSLSVPGLNPDTRYFLLITGVDSSGESLFSEQHVIQPEGAPQFSSPVASADQFVLDEDTELSGVLLDNDSHPDARSFSLDTEAVRQPQNGVVQLNADGSFAYVPAVNFVGDDSFIYQITDTEGLTAQALVSLTVTAVNDSPVALDDSFSLNKNTSLTLPAPGILANDTDIDGDKLVVDSAALTLPKHGQLQLSPDGAFSYSPDTNYTGDDSFVYQIKDAQGAVAQAKVSLRIEMTNAAPLAQNDFYQVSEDEQLVVSAANGVLANDSDPDGDSISLLTDLLSTVQNGQLIVSADGSFNYVPRQDFFGTDSFSYQIKDPSGLVSAATVEIKVLAQNDPPVVQAASYSVNSNQVLSVAAPGLLVHAFDVDDESLILSAEPVVAPAKGSLSLAADGSFSYSPYAQVSGSDSFTIKVLDSKGAFSTGTVVISIIYQASAPVLADASFEIFANAPAGFALAQLTASDTDPDDTATFSLLSGNDAGIFALSPSGLLTVADAEKLAQQSGATQTLLVQVEDSYGLRDEATLLISIAAVPVVANPDSYTVAQGGTLTVSPGVLANDSGSASGALTATLVAGPSHGQLTLNQDGSFSYTPIASFYGTDSFIYQASNGVDSAQANVTLTVTYTAPELVAHFDSYTLDEDSTLVVSAANSLLQNDTFDLNLPLTVSLAVAPVYGTLNLNTDGTFTYQPVANIYGADSFKYRLTQGDLSVDGHVDLYIEAVNDAPELQDATVTISDDYVDLQPVLTLSQYDQDPGSYSYEILSGNSAGVFAVTSDAVIKVLNSALLDADTTASYSLIVQVTENADSSLTDTATIVINVEEGNVDFLASSDSYTLDEDTTLTVTSANSVLQNDTFDATQPLSVSLVQGPIYGFGTLSLNTDGTFSFQPHANSYGTDYFTYRLTQGSLTSDAQVELNIMPVNDPPVLQDATVTISDDYVDLQPVLTLSQYDQDPGSYSYEIESGDPNGVFAVTSDAVLKVVNSALLDASTTPTYSVVIKVTENNDATLVDTATIVITVEAATADETIVNADTTFAAGGNLAIDMMLSGEYNDPVQIIPLSDGRSLVIGTINNSSNTEIFVVRLTADGTVDSSYADNGVFRNKLFSTSSSEQAVATVMTSNNELVVLANYFESGTSGFYLIKLSESGVLDSSFGSTQGYVLCTSTPCGSGNEQATDLILNHLGHFVVSGVKDGTAFLFEFADSGYQGGWHSTITAMTQFDLVRQDSQNNYYGIGPSDTGDIVVARLSSSFDLDTTSFGCDINNSSACDGYKSYDFGLMSSMVYDAVLYNDSLYVVGSVTESSAPSSPDALFFKLAADGSLDPNFGLSSGFTQVNGQSDYPLHYHSLAVDTTGFYVLTSTEQSASQDLTSLSHYDVTGQFIEDQPLDIDGQLKAVDLQLEGSALWLLQQFSNPNYGAVGTVSFNWVAKYQTTDLTADTTFSADGKRWFNAGFGSDTIMGSRRLLLGSQVNKSLFYGYSYSYINGMYQQAFVGKLTASGVLDQSFGNHGLVLVADDQLSQMEVNAVLEGQSNQLYVAGFGMDSSTNSVGFVLRLDQYGGLDSGFDGGIFDLIPNAFGNYNGSRALQLQLRADGHVLVGAEFSQTQDNYDIALIQLNTDGTLDTGTFGTSGSGFTFFTEIDTNSQTEERLSQMKVDPMDDSLVIAGQYKLTADPQLYVARFSSAGLLENSINNPSAAFGDGGSGYAVVNIIDSSSDQTKYSEYLNDFDFDAAGNLILAISKNYEGDEAHYLFRLQSDGLVSSSFNSGVPKLFDSFSDLTTVDIQIKTIELDTQGRLLMAGTYGTYGEDAWIGRVLLDGSGADVGRWDPAFEPYSATAGAYLLTGFSFSYDVFLELSGNRVTLGWSNSNASYTATMRQYQLYEYDPSPPG